MMHVHCLRQRYIEHESTKQVFLAHPQGFVHRVPPDRKKVRAPSNIPEGVRFAHEDTSCRSVINIRGAKINHDIELKKYFKTNIIWLLDISY